MRDPKEPEGFKFDILRIRKLFAAAIERIDRLVDEFPDELTNAELLMKFYGPSFGSKDYTLELSYVVDALNAWVLEVANSIDNPELKIVKLEYLLYALHKVARATEAAARVDWKKKTRVNPV